MNPEINGASTNQSIRLVRRRLWLLLLRAFGVVVLLIVVLMLGVTFSILSIQVGRNPFYQAPVAYLLESYYLGHGSWDGVEEIFTQQAVENIPGMRAEWTRYILLDGQGRIVFDQGQSASGRVGEIYPTSSAENRIEIKVGQETVGYLVFQPRPVSFPLRLAIALLPSIAGISILLGFLTLVIGLLLMRRVVDPLSEVIGAARCVAAGDFSARVPLHRRHDDLYALSASFNQMAASLEQADQQRRSMLADVAHELRTPITILRGRLEGILDGVYPADEAHIAPALEEVYLLERLVEDLRLLTLAEVRRLPLERRTFDLGELARRVSATFEAEADELGIGLAFEASPTVDGAAPAALVLGDPQRAEQVTGNLIGNALRYVPAGGQITVRLEGEGEYTWLAVADNGPGVTEEDLAFIFDRFWRGEKSRARASGGAGLGLAIARQLVEAQGGKIEAKNLAGGGFEVRFRLPGAG